MIIGVDVDDTIGDLIVKLNHWHNLVYDTNFTRDSYETYGLYETWGCTKDQSLKKLDDFFGSTIFDEVVPFEGAPQVMLALSIYHEMHIITSRPDYISEHTNNWIDRYFPETFQSVNVIGLHGNVSKSEVCHHLGIEAMIDDAPHNISDCHEAGLKTYLMEAPWNKNYSEPQGVIRVKDLYELANLLLP